MSVPIPLQRDFSAPQLRSLAKKAKDGPQARRLLTLATIYDGASRTEAAKIGGVGLQIIRDWVLRFNARGPDGLRDGKPPGQPSKLNDGQRQAIARMIESGPIPAVHGVVRWRLIDLAQWIFEEFRITIFHSSKYDLIMRSTFESACNVERRWLLAMGVASLWLLKHNFVLAQSGTQNTTLEDEYEQLLQRVASDEAALKDAREVAIAT